jgi:hypothetical protein
VAWPAVSGPGHGEDDATERCWGARRVRPRPRRMPLQCPSPPSGEVSCHRLRDRAPPDFTVTSCSRVSGDGGGCNRWLSPGGREPVRRRPAASGLTWRSPPARPIRWRPSRIGPGGGSPARPIGRTTEAPTGVALIAVDPEGNRSRSRRGDHLLTLIGPGATWTSPSADVVLLQLGRRSTRCAGAARRGVSGSGHAQSRAGTRSSASADLPRW